MDNTTSTVIFGADVKSRVTFMKISCSEIPDLELYEVACLYLVSRSLHEIPNFKVALKSNEIWSMINHLKRKRN